MKNQYSYRNVLEPVSETILDHALKSQAKNLKATNLQGITYHHELHCALLTLDCFQVTHLGSKRWKGSERNNKEKSYDCPSKLLSCNNCEMACKWCAKYMNEKVVTGKESINYHLLAITHIVKLQSTYNAFN